MQTLAFPNHAWGYWIFLFLLLDFSYMEMPNRVQFGFNTCCCFILSMFISISDWCCWWQKTRKILTEKIAQLNSAIDEVSSQLRADDRTNGAAATSDEVEAAIWSYFDKKHEEPAMWGSFLLSFGCTCKAVKIFTGRLWKACNCSAWCLSNCILFMPLQRLASL